MTKLTEKGIDSPLLFLAIDDVRCLDPFYEQVLELYIVRRLIAKRKLLINKVELLCKHLLVWVLFGAFFEFFSNLVQIRELVLRRR